MGVWLDDEFPEHPKVEALDDDLARWLYVAGLCYANRNLTGGRIPKGAALRLTDKASPKLIARLLLVLVPDKGPLWHDRGDHYSIHDYEQHQQSAEKRRAEVEDAKKKRSEHARRAALARHHPPDEQELSKDRASPEHPPGTDPVDPGADEEEGDFLAPAPPQASAVGRSTPGRPNALVPVYSSSSNHHRDGRPAADDDEGTPTEKALALMADRRIAAAIAAGNVILNPGGYRRRTLESLNGELGDKAEAMLKAGATPEAVADKLVPVGSAAASRWPTFEPPPDPDEPLASAGGLAGVRSALGGGA